MATAERPKPTFSALGRWAIGFNVCAGIVAALALAIMANYLSARHHWRFQMAMHRKVELSPQTVRVLRSLTNEVKVTVFFDTRNEEELYRLVNVWLREYSDHNPRIVVRTVDPTRHPADAELVLATYKLGALKARNFVVFDCDGRTRVFYQGELADIKLEPVPDRPREVQKEIVRFHGEELFTPAIFNLANPRQFKICFTQGHGEHDADQPPSNPHGYWKFAQALREKISAELERISLFGTNDIPADCQLLIIAGPRQAFNDLELAKVESFLRQGGRLLALLANPVLAQGGRSGLEKVLAKWNVAVGDGAITDPKPPTPNALLTVRMNNQHPVTKALVSDSEDFRVLLVLPRFVRPAPGSSAPDAPRVDVLAASSPEAREVTDIRNGVPYPDPLRDRADSFPLIVAVEQGIKGVTAERGATRIIVVGDSLCLDNEQIDQPCGNHYFGTLAVNWLLDRPQILLEGLVPQPLKSYRLVMSEQQLRTAWLVLPGGLPGIVLLLGAAVWWRRRH